MQIGRCEEFQSWRFERKPYVRAKDSSEQKNQKTSLNPHPAHVNKGYK